MLSLLNVRIALAARAAARGIINGSFCAFDNHTGSSIEPIGSGLVFHKAFDTPPDGGSCQPNVSQSSNSRTSK